MTNKWLVWYLEKKKEIDEWEFGFRKKKKHNILNNKNNNKNSQGIRRYEKTAAIFFDIKKVYDKVNKEKKLEQLEKRGIQGKMAKFIRELIGERWIKVRQTDLGIPQRGVLSVTIFLMVINGILWELGNGVDGSLFTDDLAIYIIKRSQRVISRAF